LYKGRKKNGLDTRVFFHKILPPRGELLNEPGGLPYSARGTYYVIVSTHFNLPRTFGFTDKLCIPPLTAYFEKNGIKEVNS
jgi:hypothetical protein